MTLQQLKYIVTIDKYRHFGKAAEACELTQSTLSLMVKKLEEELDVIIFDRSIHPVEPTEMGRKIIDQAKIVLYNADQIVEMAAKEKEILSGPLKIALISTVAPTLVPGLFKYIGTHHPDIQMQTQEMLTDTIQDRLHKAEVDIGIVTAPVNDPELLEIPLWTEHFLAYVSESHPLFQMESIPTDLLIGRHLWIMKDGVKQWKVPSLPLNYYGSYEHFFEGGRIGTLIQIVDENGGLTIIPETHVMNVAQHRHRNLRPLTGQKAPERTISLIIRRDYIHEAILNSVIQAIRTVVPKALSSPVIQQDYIHL